MRFLFEYEPFQKFYLLTPLLLGSFVKVFDSNRFC